MRFKNCQTAVFTKMPHFFARMEVLQDPETLDMSDFPTLAFAARASAEDNPRFDEAMRGPNAEGFWQASAKEITTLQKINTWTQVPREAGMNVIKSTWAFKIKIFPDTWIHSWLRSDIQGEARDTLLKSLR